MQTEKNKSKDLLGVVAEKITIKGLTPGKRHSHSLVADQSYNIIILAGGFDDTAEQLFELFIFDVHRQAWLKADHFGVQPKAFAQAQFVKIPFTITDFNDAGLLNYIIKDQASNSYWMLTMIVDLQA